MYNWLNTDIENLALIATSNKINGSDFHAFLEDISTTETNVIISGPSSGTKYCLTQILVTNGSATIATKVTIYDNAGKAYVGFAGISGGGFSINFPSENPLMFGDGASISVGCGTTGSDINVSINGFISNV